MKEIVSAKNPMIKELKKLHKRKYREENKKYIIEGFHLIEEAMNAGASIETILFNLRGQKEWSEWLRQQEQEKLMFVSDDILKSLSDLPTPQGILAVVGMPKIKELKNVAGGWLFLDNVQDPGNVGTMIRTADAAGFSGVLIGEGTADIYSTKVLRAMQGSNYHIPIVRGDLKLFTELFEELNVPIYGTELNSQAVSYEAMSKIEDFGLIMGNEGQGVSKELLAKTTKNLYIPISGEAESLNVAVAAGILMFHLKA